MSNPWAESYDALRRPHLEEGDSYSSKKMASKDHDGDGKIESGSKEHAGVVHNAIQRAKGKKPDGKDTRREEVSHVDEKFSMAYDKSKPQSPRPTRKAENKKGVSAKSRTMKAVGTQRRQDKETGVSEEKSVWAGNYKGPLYAPHPDLAEGKKKGLWDNIHAKRKRGEAPAKKGDKDYPKTLNVEAKVDEKTPDYKRATVRDKRYGNPHRSFELGGGIRKDRRADHEARRGVKTKGMKEETLLEKGMSEKDMDSALKGHKYSKKQLMDMSKKSTKEGRHGEAQSMYKAARAVKEDTINERGDFWHPDPEKDRKLGGPGANQRAREDRAAASKPAAKKEDPKKLRKGESYMDYAKRQKGYTPPKKKEGLGDKIKRKLGLKREEVEVLSFGAYLSEGNRTGRMMQKSKTQVTGHISADRGSDEKKNREGRKNLEKDLKKHGIGHKKGVGEYKYDSGETGREVSYQTSKPDKMSKRRFGKVMRRMGRKHGQESVITKDKDKPAKLHYTEKGSKAKSDSIGKSKAGKHPEGYGETSGTKVRGGKLPKKTNKSSYHYG